MSQSPFSLKLNNVGFLLDKSGDKTNANGNEPTQSLPTLALASITLLPTQPRRYFDPEQQQELVASVKEHGILQPLLVRPLDGGGYELVAGERRYRAAKEVGLSEVPVIVKKLTDSEALQIALIENLQREDLNVLEEAEGILKLLAITLKLSVEEVISLLYRMQNEAAGKVTENVLSSESAQVVIGVFQSLGTITWESFIPSRLHLLNLPLELLESLRRGELEYTKAKELAKIKDEEQRQALLRQAIDEHWSLSQLKEKIRNIQSPAKSENSPQSRIREFTERLKRSKAYKEPKTWKKIESYLKKIENLL